MLECLAVTKTSRTPEWDSVVQEAEARGWFTEEDFQLWGSPSTCPVGEATGGEGWAKAPQSGEYYRRCHDVSTLMLHAMKTNNFMLAHRALFQAQGIGNGR